jgi:hypothetical protein
MFMNKKEETMHSRFDACPVTGVIEMSAPEDEFFRSC